MKKEIKDYTIQFIKEIVPVIAGILISLFIDNWNSERKDKVYINQVFSTINSELKDSKEDIKATIPRQKALIDSLEFYSSNKNVKLSDIILKSKGIYIPQIKINAWKSVSSTKIDLVDYNQITTLSNIQELKELLNNKSELLGTFLYANINETEKNQKQTLKMILMDIIQIEKSIQQNIELFEKK